MLISKLQVYSTDFSKHKPNAKQKDSPVSFTQQPSSRLRMPMFCPIAEGDMVTLPVRKGIAISGPDRTSLPLRATDFTGLQIKPLGVSTVATSTEERPTEGLWQKGTLKLMVKSCSLGLLKLPLSISPHKSRVTC